VRHVGSRVDDGDNDGIAPLRDVPGERRTDRVQAPELGVARVVGSGVELVGQVRPGDDDVASALERTVGCRERHARVEPGTHETAQRHALDERRADQVEGALLRGARLEAHEDLLPSRNGRSGVAGSRDSAREGEAEHGEESGSWTPSHLSAYRPFFRVLKHFAQRRRPRLTTTFTRVPRG